MIDARLLLEDGREIKVKLRPREYRKLTVKLTSMSFWSRLKLAFLPRAKV